MSELQKDYFYIHKFLHDRLWTFQYDIKVRVSECCLTPSEHFSSYIIKIILPVYVAPLGHIILIPSQPVFGLSLSGEAAKVNFIL